MYGQMKYTSEELAAERDYAEKHDEWMKPRIEYMYNYFDYDHDRTVIREKFLMEMHKKTTVKDIGEKLDEFILDSKADVAM